MIFGNMGEMMKMAKEMQGQLKKIKEELAREIYDGVSHGVVARVSGDMEIKEIKIDPKVIDPNKAGQLEKNIQEAVGKALKTAKEKAAKKMKGLTGGMGLPGMM